jgi:hypothetical protein
MRGAVTFLKRMMSELSDERPTGACTSRKTLKYRHASAAATAILQTPRLTLVQSARGSFAASSYRKWKEDICRIQRHPGPRDARRNGGR